MADFEKVIPENDGGSGGCGMLEKCERWKDVEVGGAEVKAQN